MAQQYFLKKLKTIRILTVSRQKTMHLSLPKRASSHKFKKVKGEFRRRDIEWKNHLIRAIVSHSNNLSSCG